jgi:hypothetical protein
MQIEREKIRSALLNKGFRTKDGDHKYYYLFVEGKKSSVFTKLSHGGAYKVYGDDLINEVKHQMGLTKAKLLEYVDCTLDYNGYINILKQSGRIR